MSRRSLLCVTLLLAGCTASPPTAAPPPNVDLVAFDSCDELGVDLRAAAAAHVDEFGLDGFSYGKMRVRAGGPRSPGPAPSTADDFSATNNQEAGADEPDIVKTDGRRIVTIGRDGVLRVVDAVSRVQTGKVKLGVSNLAGDPQLLLSGDRALVLVPPSLGHYRYAPVPGKNGLSGLEYIGEPGNPQIILVDLAGVPAVTSRYTGEGTIVDARQTGAVARVVLKTVPRISFPQQPYDVDKAKGTAINRAVLNAAPAADWLPNWQVTTGTKTVTGHVGCDRVSRPTEYSGTSMVTVLTFDLGRAGLSDGDPVSVVADGDTVYGTPTSLYVTNDLGWRNVMGSRRDRADRTQIFRFDTHAAGRPAFVADGSVPGVPLNRYALSEWDGRMRIATSDAADGEGTSVRVLQQQGSRLVQTGVVGGLGKGESIEAVRFIGPRGYVVTFKQTDPLFGLDLSDPAKPKVTGALKIDGYSEMLQPIGGDRLIGVGRATTAASGDVGLQVSLFDVSNPAVARRLARQQVARVTSDAESDPHALLWWPATNLLVVPLAAWDPQRSGQQNAAMALRVTDNGLHRIGLVRQPGNSHPKSGQQRFPIVERSFVAGGVLWTLSDQGLQASDLSSLDQLSWLSWLT